MSTTYLQGTCVSHAIHTQFTCNVCTTYMEHTCNTGVTRITFSFLDPVYVWIRQAQLLVERGKELVWKPKIVRQQPSNEPMYGSGIECGLLLRHAVESVPEGGYPALMNLSWDSGATNMKSRSAVPICLQVYMQNTCKTHTIHTQSTCVSHAKHTQGTCVSHVIYTMYTCDAHATYRL